MTRRDSETLTLGDSEIQRFGDSETPQARAGVAIAVTAAAACCIISAVELSHGPIEAPPRSPTAPLRGISSSYKSHNQSLSPNRGL